MKKTGINNIFIFFAALLIASCGGGGGGGSSPATVSLSSNLSEVLVGQNATLTWSSDQSSCSASGAWSGAKASSGTESVTIGSAGNNNFSISCGNGSASASVLGYRNSEGIVADGYISDATVFIDSNDNLSLDDGELSVLSDGDGKFSMRHSNGTIVSIGGKDVDTQTLLDSLVLAAPNDGYVDSPAITPLTTLAVIMDDPANLNSVLGIDPSINILTTDPVANLVNGGMYNVLYEKGNQVTVLALALKNIIDATGTPSSSTANAMQSIAVTLETLYSGTLKKVDIESNAFLSAVIDQVAIDQNINLADSVKSNSITALSAIMPLIQVKSDRAVLNALINFSLNTLQTDITSIASGTDLGSISQYSGDIKSYIASVESVSASSLRPIHSIFNDSASTDEDTAVTIDILNNDSLVPGDPIISITLAPSKGSLVLEDGVVIYTPNKDANGDDSFEYNVQIAGITTQAATVNVTINPVNDAPSISSQTSAVIVEGNTSVSDVVISDVDGDDVTVTLSGEDADSFDVIDGVLTFKSAPDFFVKNSYLVTIVATDGTLETSVDLTISVRRQQVEGFDIPDAIKVIETL